MERNAPCKCGSGKKYKRCCALKQNRLSKTSIFLIIVVALASLAALALTFVEREGQLDVPPGRVWSPEHGHWH